MYLDLDGTLLGPGGALLRGAGGAFSDASVRALALLHLHAVPAVLVSGRSRLRLETAARLIGADGVLPELGALDAGYPAPPGRTVHEAIAATGIPDALLRREPGLEVHAPAMWGREGSHVFRGTVSGDAAAWVAEASGGTLRLADNGSLGPLGHVFHLLPRDASKGAAVARDVARRGLDPARCLVVGDSAEDMEMGAAVGTCALVFNGWEAAPHLEARATLVTAGRYGDGVLEAVTAWLGPSAQAPGAAMGSGTG